MMSLKKMFSSTAPIGRTSTEVISEGTASGLITFELPLTSETQPQDWPLATVTRASVPTDSARHPTPPTTRATARRRVPCRTSATTSFTGRRTGASSPSGPA